MKIKPSSYSIYLALCITLLFSACKAIIEPSISDRKVVPLAPGYLTKSASYAVTFWWEPVEDALSYNLHVVGPSFSSIGTLVADTVVTSNKFTLNLKPGDYQWRVSAMNGSSQTAFSRPWSFTVLLSSIKGQSVQLKSPPNNYLTNQNTVNLEWSSLSGATKYTLQIDTNSFADESKLVYNQAIPAQQFTFTFPKDQAYQWRVRAENDTAKADWSAINVMLHDHAPPAPVNIVAPTNNQVVSSPVSLQWSAVAAAAKYKLYAFKSDSATVYNNTFPAELNGTNYNFSVGTIGERVIWKVAAVDAAGNEGQATAVRSFVLR
ncbi:hypothetical protein [Mucilaginibacter sp. HD30]